MDTWWLATLVIVAAAFLSAWAMMWSHKRTMKKMYRQERKMFRRPVDDRLWWEPH